MSVMEVHEVNAAQCDGKGSESGDSVRHIQRDEGRVEEAGLCYKRQ